MCTFIPKIKKLKYAIIVILSKKPSGFCQNFLKYIKVTILFIKLYTSYE